MQYKKDKYILLGIKSSYEEIQSQRQRGYNPGVVVVLKDIASHETVDARFNLDAVEEIKEHPGSFHFTGIVSDEFRIGKYFYGQECLVDGYASEDEDTMCLIHITPTYREFRDYVSPREKNKRHLLSKENYIKWRLQQQLAAPATV